MHAYAVVILASIAKLALAADCHVGPYDFRDDGDFIDIVGECLNQTSANPSWDSKICGENEQGGGQTVQFYGHNWNSPSDCLGGCYHCLYGAAMSGARWAKCDNYAGAAGPGGAHCAVGYSPQGYGICGSDEPCKL